MSFNSFDFSDLADPIATRFNKEVSEFISLIKQHIGFDEEKDISHYPQKDQNGFIREVVIERNFVEQRGSGITVTFFPNVHGNIDVMYHDLADGKKIKRTDIPVIFFFSSGNYEGSIDELKNFFQKKHEFA